MKTRSPISLSILLLTLDCGGGGTAPTPAPQPVAAPVIASFAASPSTITAGQSSTLGWTVTGATSLSLSGQGTVTGTSLSVTPTTTTTYTLTATNTGGSATAQATVTVTPGIPTIPSTWTRVSENPALAASSAAVFTLANRAYVGTGRRSQNDFSSDFWEFNPESQAWTRKASFPGTPMANAGAFSIGSLGYLGLGLTPATSQEFWAFDPATNAWTRRADFAGEPRIRPMAVAAGGKGYVMGGLGDGGRLYRDLWAYDPTANTWTRKTDFPGPAKSSPLGFAIGDRIYVCMGEAAAAIDPTLWEYDTQSDQWSQRRSFPGTVRWGGTATALGAKGYLGLGAEESYLSDLWEYDSTQDTWAQQASLPTAGRAGAVAFGLGEELYLGLGSFNQTPYPGPGLSDLWRTAPSGLLGQVLPGATPRIFSKAFLADTGSTVFGVALSPDGRELIYTLATGTARTIMGTRLVDGTWTTPAPMSFTMGFGGMEPHLTLDSRTVYFSLFHPTQAGIYAADRTATGWSAARYVGEGMFVSSSRDGQVYVTDLSSTSGAYLAKAVLGPDGRFLRLERLTGGMEALRAQYPNQAHPAIAPDGSYLVFDVEGGAHLFVCFRQADGTWGPAIDLAQQGIDARNGVPYITPDGKYLFCGIPTGDLSWVSTDLILRLRPASN